MYVSWCNFIRLQTYFHVLFDKTVKTQQQLNQQHKHPCQSRESNPERLASQTNALQVFISIKVKHLKFEI